MTDIRPTSYLLETSNHSTSRIMLDANILISAFDTNHENHCDALQLIEHISLNEGKFFFVQPCYLEILEYWRRKSISEYIEERLENNLRVTSRFDQRAREYLREIGGGNKRGGRYLRDHQIKNLRDLLLQVGGKNKKQKGRNLWLQFCRSSFEDRLRIINEQIRKMEITFARFGDSDVYPKHQNLPTWDDMVNLIEKFCLSSHDAAILNMVAGGKNITGFVTSDSDMIIAAENGALPREIVCYELSASKKSKQL